MNRFIYSAAAIAATLTFASCSNDEPVHEGIGDDAVSFTIKVPGDLATRSTFGDESTVLLDNLQWSVYDVNDSESGPLFTSQKASAFQSDQTTETVNLQLIKGKTYKVVFYADNDADKFVTFNDGVLSVDYEAGASNIANEDAFIGESKVFTLDAAGYSETITLTRPFAQLNWGTDDLDAEIVKKMWNELSAQVTVKSGLYSKMNVFTGEYTDAVGGEVAFPAVQFANLPTETFPEVSPYKSYSLLCMNYLLTGEGTIDCTLNFAGINEEVTVSAASVNRNYRTNIFGSLITAPASFNILVSNKFDKDDFLYPINNAADFLKAHQAGKSITIDEGTTIDISSLGEIELKNGQNLEVNGILRTNRQQISVSGNNNEVTVSGTGTIIADGPMGNRPLNVYDGATLNVEGVTVSTAQNNGGSAIFSENGILVLKNMKSLNNSNFAIGANGGRLTMENCEIASDSNNQQGAFSYTIGVNAGCKATLTNVRLNGVQGGISVDGENSICTIVSGTYQTRHLPGTNNTGFYPVYITNHGQLVVEGGNFIAPSNRYTIYDGDNDIQMPFADKIVLKGGKYNRPTHSANKEHEGEIPAADGFEWKTIEEAPYILTIQPKKN